MPAVAKKPRKRAVVHGCIDSDTLILDDQRLHQWTGGTPPRNFCVYKTVFRNMTPAEVSANGWHVLRPAVPELASGCGLEAVSPKIDWLKLDTVLESPCRVGIFGDEIITAAASPKSERTPYIPFRYFEHLEKNKDWKNKTYWSSYRHFNAHFDIGLSFYTDRHKLLCDVSYAVHFGIHHFHSLIAMIRVNDENHGETTLLAPWRLRVSETLFDLPGKIEWIGRQSQEFIARIGAGWLRECDSEMVYNSIARRVRPYGFPEHDLQALTKDRSLAKCLTKLDMLLIISRHFKLDTERYAVPLLKLSQDFFSKG
jgi:hypothetical protein